MNVVLVGGPGAGKGSLAKFITRDFGAVHISSGDLLRELVKNGSEIGKKIKSHIDGGTLVPDELITEMILTRIGEPDCKRGFILDGFPRTIKQAESLTKAVKINYVVQIDASVETVVARLGGRFMCKKCGTIYNKLWHNVTKCESCGGELYQRDDDKEETIKKRYNDYLALFNPIVDYYKKQKGVTVLTTESRLCDAPENMYENFIAKHGKVFK